MRVPSVHPGEVIDIVAPASACSREALSAGVAVIEGWGFRPRVPSGLFEGSDIVAAPDESRYRTLHRALRHPDSRVIWCVRGGYGSQRLLPRLARGTVPERRKLLVGFSDLTALHVFVNQRWGWPTLHAATLADLGSGRLSQRSLVELRRVVAGRTSRLSFRLRPLNSAACRTGSVGGALVGGNLKTIQSLVGTPWSVRPAGRILMMEDTGERGYAIDRMLVQLAQAGLLRGVRALVFGQFTGGREPDGRFTGTEVIARFAERMRVPVLDGAPFGHGDAARAVLLGLPVKLELGPDGARMAIAWTSDRTTPGRETARPSGGRIRAVEGVAPARCRRDSGGVPPAAASALEAATGKRPGPDRG